MSTLPTSESARKRTRISLMPVVAAVVVLALIAVLAVFIASRNGGSASPGVANVGPTPTIASQTSQSGATQSKAAAYSSCMRSHGVPSFPDPNSQGKLFLKVTKGGPLDPSSPQFQAAQQDCKSLAPSQNASSGASSQLQSQGLAFSACMRSHGMTSFPDPQVSGGHFMMTLPTGIDPNSPVFQSAMQACQSLMPGGAPGAGQ
jgi:hypothetical protein